MRTVAVALLLFVLSWTELPAQNTPSTAWQGLQQEQKSLKDGMVLGAQLTEDGNGQLWEFQLLDKNYKSDRRIVSWSKGTLGGDSAGRLQAFEREDLAPLTASDLNLSVSSVRGKVQELLEDAGKKAVSTRYALSRRKGKEQALWNVTCLGGNGERLAVMTFNAENRQLLQVDLKPSNPKVQEVEQEAKSFGKEVEKTFKGIGADLEEFFTGKRTVDQ